MPLPTAGGAPAPQSAAESPVSMPSVMSSAPAGTPAFPPKSERRPVVFDRSDGPSDFEKRLMANKKQKQEQEAKQRGPDRRRVRTERVEISSSDSKEVNRDFAPFESVKPTVSSLGSVPTIQREMLEPSGSNRSAAPSPSKTSEKSISAVDSNQTIQRKIDFPVKQAASAEKTVQRESLRKGNPVSSRSEALPRAAEFISAVNETVQREMPSGNLFGKELPDSTEMDGEVIPVNKETVQRESLKRADPIGKSAKQSSKTAKPAASADISGTVQRQSAVPAEDFGADENPVAPSSDVKSDIRETVQREANPSVKSVSSREKTSAAPGHSAAETVRREILTAEEQETQKSGPSADAPVSTDISAKTVRREPLKAAQPAAVHSNDHQGKTVQRETLKAAAPVVNDAEQPSFSVISAPSAVETIQREEMPAAPESRSSYSST